MAVFTGKFNSNKRWKRLAESKASEKNGGLFWVCFRFRSFFSALFRLHALKVNFKQIFVISVYRFRIIFNCALTYKLLLFVIFCNATVVWTQKCEDPREIRQDVQKAIHSGYLNEVWLILRHTLPQVFFLICSEPTACFAWCSYVRKCCLQIRC